MLSIIMAVSMTPVSTASAAVEATYIDENGVSQTVAATVIENATTALTSNWYVVEGSVNTTNLTLVNHHVSLILTDGCTLTAGATGDKAAIELFNGNTLTIYGQALGTGTLTATGSGKGAGIGGSGGADGSTTGEGQAGQAGGDSGALTVVGGRVIADRIGGGDGGEGLSQNEGKKDGGRGGGGGTITVKGGSLEVSGKVGGGNGGSSQYLRGGDGGRLTGFTVTGGMVNIGSISGGNGGNGIYETYLGGFPIAVGIAGNGGSGGSASISGGSVNVSGKLGGGDAGRTSFHSESPGNGGSGSALTVSGGTVRISGSIGGGSNSPLFGSSSDHGSCIVTGGSLRAPSLRPTPTNGSANGNNTVLATTVKLGDTSGTVAVKHLITGTTYTYGTKDVLTDAEGNLFLWLPDGAVITQANTENAAYSGTVAAGENGTLAEIPLDTEKPTVLSITPTNGTTDVPDSNSISVTFSEVMAPSAGTVSLSPGEGSPIILTGGAWSSSNSVYTISYSSLSYGGVYTITISGFQDLAGNMMEDNSSCSFQVKILPIYNYVDQAGVASTASAIKIDSATTGLTSGWYAAEDSLTLTNLSVSGNVHLILTDGCKLTINGTDHNAAVRVSGGSSLTIYGQTLGTGALTAESAGRGAGIGGNGGVDGFGSSHGESSGTVTFNGGTVTTNRIGGGDGSNYLFNSGFNGGHGGTVTINGGTVIVSGRIGGGDGGEGTSGLGAGGNGGNGSSLTIRGGNVSVAGKIGGGAAGSGYYRNQFTGAITYGTAGGPGSCTITGGSARASIIQPTPKNDGGSTVSLTTVTLNGVATLQTIQAIVTDLPLTYGTRDMKTDASGKLYLWLPSGASVTAAFSRGSRYTGSIPAGTSGTLAVSGAVPEPPVVSSIAPAHGELDVPVNGSIAVTFNGVMDAWSGSVTLRADDLDTIVLTRGIWSHSGTVYTVSYSGLSYSTEYTVTLSGFQDAYGQEVDSASLVFTTAAPPKSVTVGAQSSTLICGTAGSVAFPITVVSIADGTYSVALDGAPDGVTTGDIAIASGSGTLTVNASADTPEGSYTMTATIDGTVSDSFILTVSGALPTVDSVSVLPAAVEVQKGATQQLTATVTGTNHPAQTVTWEVIDNLSTATNIDASGLLTVGADETAASLTVRATSTVDISISGSATVTVTEIPAPPVYQISLGYIFPAAAEGYNAPTPLTIPVTNTGNQPTGDLTVALGGSNHGDFILSKTTIDSIAASGSDSLTVTPKDGLTAGTYTATVSVSGGNGINKSFDIIFTVNSASSLPVTGVSLDKSILNLTVGGNSTLIATVEPANASNTAVSWSSSDPSVAMVDHNGAVTANSVGMAIITVTTEDGSFAAACTVTVSEAAPVTTYTVTFDLNGGTRTGGGQLTQTVVHGGSATAPTVARSGYTFTGWNQAFNHVTSNLTVTAAWSQNSSGSDDTGKSGRGSSTPSTLPAARITTDKKPGQPTIATMNLTAAVDRNGMASVTITEAQAKALIDSAKKYAQARGEAVSGIGVSITIDLPNTAKSFSAILSQAGLERLIDAGVKQLEINSRLVCLTLDLEALQEIQKQSTGHVTVTIQPAQNLSEAAKQLIGARPVYDMTITYVRDGKTVNITSLGKGSATLGIPYTPGQNEATGFLYAIHVDGNGNTSRIPGSAYDTNSRRVVFTTNHFSVYGVGYTAPSAQFIDIGAHWAKDSIDYVAGRGLFGSSTDGKFQPDTAITRADFVSALGRLSGVNVSGCQTSSFTDVIADSYYLPYVEWAYEKGIIKGIGNNRFAPDRAIIREEIAVILQNYAKATGYKLPVTREATIFADAFDIGANYKSAVTAMQQAGIMLGEQNNNFNPKANATRAEASAMLHRYIKLTINPATAK